MSDSVNIKEVDEFIGKRIYESRLAQGMHRQHLAKMIDVTQQQLIKYEKGINRISLGRLMLIAKALRKDMSYFHEWFEPGEEVIVTKQQTTCIEMSRNFMKIQSSEHQSAINSLIKSLLKAEQAA
ncbi:MAG: transcriptional regulator [Rickettsiales bacterium]|nr:MAG: transcriptional regulator [Rickettsiales bacterium]